MSEDPRQNKSYQKQATEFAKKQYENWAPWMEDQYLKWFTRDNKASYATKEQLSQTKISGIDQVDKLQDGVNNTVGDAIGQGGIGQPVGDAVSKEGITRAEESQGPAQSAGEVGKGVGKGLEYLGGVGESAGGLLGGGGKGKK